MITALVAIAFKFIGVAFLVLAAFGLLRFSDPFQRMHAATKAGTLGAGFVVAGAIVAIGTWGAILIGLGTILFLLLTVPVAGHLLGRAAYVSGADLNLAPGRDALNGILPRQRGGSDAPPPHD